ncbi:MAG TPA: glycerophosphodiester phosphodiesterase family protein [Armatimonadota bacterium]|nr:glycerophosphodiester phosphodiesterase family protein [Armatimonadota bacterium]
MPAKRCIDCTNFLVPAHKCNVLGVEVNEVEAKDPTTLSQSFRCPQYQQSPEANSEALRRREAGAAQPRKREAPAKTQPKSPPKEKRPHVIAHRACCGGAPENTLAAVKAAVELGIDAFEVDVHVTKDGVPVVIHDATLDRTTSGAGAVHELGFDQIRGFDAGSWVDPKFHNERIPTLREVLQHSGKPLVNIHVKCHENESDRAEKAIVAAIKDSAKLDRCWITHHTRHGLYRFRELEKKLRLCFLPRDGGDDIEYIDDAFYMGYRIIQPSFRAVTEEFVEYARRRKMWINVFWADDEDLMRELTALGVNGILTNDPALLQNVVGAKSRATSSADS